MGKLLSNASILARALGPTCAYLPEKYRSTKDVPYY